MCYSPIEIKTGYYVRNKLGINEWKHSVDNSTMLVPCRKCFQCRQTRATMWSLRCHFELLNHKEATFITLTYETSPVVLVKKNLQDFIKRLRRHIDYSGNKARIKYFACGEYGKLNNRPHFHIIVFGYDFKDKTLQSKSKKGHDIYTSQTLASLWKYGYHTIQEANITTCRYTALYASKSKETLPLHLKNAPEFNLMSQNLGNSKILENIDTYFKTDEIYVEGHRYNIPQSVLNKLYPTTDDKLESSVYQILKYNRVRKAKSLELERHTKYYGSIKVAKEAIAMRRRELRELDEYVWKKRYQRSLSNVKL